MAPDNVHAMIVNSAEKHQPHEIEKEIHQLTNEREWILFGKIIYQKQHQKQH